MTRKILKGFIKFYLQNKLEMKIMFTLKLKFIFDIFLCLDLVSFFKISYQQLELVNVWSVFFRVRNRSISFVCF